MKESLSSSIVFSSITVFDMLKEQLHIVFYVLNQAISGKVSLDRVDNFVKHVRYPRKLALVWILNNPI